MRRVLNFSSYRQGMTSVILGILLVVVIGVSISCVKWNFKADAVTDTNMGAYATVHREKVVTKVCVEKGTSLWKYADLYFQYHRTVVGVPDSPVHPGRNHPHSPHPSELNFA